MTRVFFGCVLAPLLVALGCGWDYEPEDNVLPTPPAAEGSSSDSDSDSDDPTLPTDSAETGEPETDFPATYRFDCMDIKAVGDADPEVFQVATLQTTWAADIANFKLNILVDVLSEDPDTGAGEITIRSGVGMGWDDQCGQGETDSSMFSLPYDPAITQWEPSDAEGQCAQAIDSSGGAGTYTLDLGAQDQVFIYSEDNDGTNFACSLEGNPNAIPVYALKSTISLTEDRSQMAGELTACIVESEALQICSCLGVCAGNVHPDCEGCPGGAVPLGLLLGGINPTDACTELMGETAYDFTFEFSARRLAAVPETCG